MMISQSTAPNWLRKLERKIGWLEIPQIAILLVTLQGLGFLFLSMDPAWYERLARLPDAVKAGEYWRLVTFLAIPMSMSPLWLFFGLWFLYFVVNSLESEWGAFRTTFYVLISIIVTVAFSLGFDYPILQVTHFESTLFLAAAALFPDYEIRLFFVIPAKLKWLGWLTGAFVIFQVINGTWLDRLYFLAIFSNFLIFFGPAALGTVKQAIRRYRYKRQL